MKWIYGLSHYKDKILSYLFIHYSDVSTKYEGMQKGSYQLAEDEQRLYF